MDAQSIEVALDTYKMVRKKFMEAGDSVFGPGIINMAEYQFLKKNGHNPFAMLFSEPRIVYDKWVSLFKGEEPVRMLLENAAGPAYMKIFEYIKRNDGVRVWNAFSSISGRTAATV